MREGNERDERRDESDDNSSSVPLMPSSEETEAEVLGAILRKGESWWNSIKMGAGGDQPDELFWDDRNRIIAEAIGSLADEGKKVIVSSVVDRLRATGNDEVFAPNARSHLTNLSVRSSLRDLADLGDSINVLAEQRARRIAIDETEMALEELRSNVAVDPMSLMDNLTNEISKGVIGSDLTTAASVLDKMEADAQDETNATWFVPTGIKCIDENLRGGLASGSMYVCGARPKNGKSMFGMNSTLNALQDGAVVLFFSFEVDATDVMRKLMSSQTMIPLEVIEKIEMGNATPEEILDPEAIEEYYAVREDLKAVDLIVEDLTTTRNEREMFAKMMAVRAQFPGRKILIVVDYVGLIASPSYNGEPKNQQVGRVSRRIKRLSLELSLASIVIAQINRSGESDGSEPEARHLKDSGDLEQDADAVFILHKPGLYDKEVPDDELVFKIAVSRKSMPMRAVLQMIGQCQAILEPNERDSQSTSSSRADSSKASEENDGEENLDDI